MTSATSLAFPGSRTLAAWWRQLAPFRPLSLAVGYLFTHRVEASACWVTSSPLDPLLALVLEALALTDKGASAGSNWQRLQQVLRLDLSVLNRLVDSLARLGLLEGASGPAKGSRVPHPSAEGLECLRTGQLRSRQWHRHAFTFVERLDAAGHRLAPPHYLRIDDFPGSPWPVENGARFHGAFLAGCANQSAEWKSTFGFPSEVVSVAAPGDDQPLRWDQVMVDKTERLLVAFCHVAGPQSELLGFGARQEGWALQPAEPVIRVSGSIDLFSEVGGENLSLWRAAWQAWCQARGLPTAQVHECALNIDGVCLQVRAPASFVVALQATRSDVLRGDTWLTAGEGYVRRAARIVVKDISQ